MSRPSHHEESQLVAQAEPIVPRLERVAIVIGAGSCLAVLAIGLVLYLIRFQVGGRTVQACLIGVVAISLLAFVQMTPASRLTPVERMVRSNRLVFLFLGLMTGAAILGSILTACSLHTTEDWFMLAFIASSPIGVYFLVYTHFGLQ